MSERTESLGPAVEKLFERYVEEHVLSGVAPDPEELCASQPELLGPLLEHVREYRRLRRDLTAPGDLEPGRELLHYRVVEKLGEGGMGQVYAAEDSRLGRRVALKVLPPELAGDAERRERLRREARAVAALSHPNIVTVHAIEEADGLSFLTMELVKGTTLGSVIPTDGLPSKKLLTLAVQIAGAVAAAHERGVTHRDLKPDNVMVDDAGTVKVLDFGLAKKAPGLTVGDGTTTPLTQTGRVLGTVPYMSPEQLNGRPADARSDVFSFGILLYQLATGRRPFVGGSPAELISALLRDDPPPVGELRGDLPGRLGEIVARCLEKDPADRYPSAREVCDDLSRLSEEVDSGTAVTASATVRRQRRRTAGWWLAAAVLAVLAVAAVFVTFRQRPSPTVDAGIADPAPAVDSAGPSLAVLHFQNLKGEPELDWLRGGITEMLVTDLSQSPEIEVLSTSRLRQILAERGALEEPTLSLEQVREVAEKAGVEAVVRGSFARAGEVLRIAFTIEEAASGDVLETFRVEERGEESLFAMVDELAGAIRGHFEVARRPGAPASIAAVTTSSLAAWRYYSEGIELNRQSKRQEAIALLERAVEADPDFALALGTLGSIHGNLGHAVSSREYLQRAVEEAHRLPLDQRFAIEGAFFATRWHTYPQAIDTFEQAGELYPGRLSLRHNLAAQYLFQERFQEAVSEFETLIEQGTTYAPAYSSISDGLTALGRYREGNRLLVDYAGRNPDSWFAQLALAWNLVLGGELEKAAAALRRADELRPGEFMVAFVRWRLEVLRQDWSAAGSSASAMTRMDDPYARWRGAVSEARNLLYGGRSQEALKALGRATQAYPRPEAYGGLAHAWAAELLLQMNEPLRALSEARRAQQEAPGEWPQLQGLFYAALAEEALGRSAAADAVREELQASSQAAPGPVEERQLNHLDGLLALARGDREAALAALRRAAALLPPRGVEIHWHAQPDHVPIWFALGEAELAAGRLEAAGEWFQKVAASGAEHIEFPVQLVRSFYHLGAIHRQGGETAAARRLFERFLDSWRDGDLDRAQVAEALEFTAASVNRRKAEGPAGQAVGRRSEVSGEALP